MVEPLNWSCYTQYPNEKPTGNVEIYKFGLSVNEQENDLLARVCGDGIKRYVDYANNVVAFDITPHTNDYDKASAIVDELNKLAEPYYDWYVGEPTEEYVYVE